jgi:hypothetical protein
MIHPVASAAQTQAATQSPAARQKPSETKPQPAVTDTVQLSSTKAIAQELTETSAQTTREANAGDIQARNLQARQAATKTK